MTTDQTITVTVKPEIDREAVEEAARAAAALFLSSFAVAVLEGIAAEEPPAEVLERVKAETLEKAAQDGENAPLAGAGHDQAPVDPQPARSAPGAAQTLADLTPCLGDRVRARDTRENEREFTYVWHNGFSDYVWSRGVGMAVADAWTVLEHLDPVTPEEPPVGAGMLVDSCAPVGCLRKRFDEGWRCCDAGDWLPSHSWEEALKYGHLRPATPADLAEHGVDEQGESVGKGEADTLAVTLERREDDMTAAEARKAARIARGITSDSTATRLLDAYADALDGAR